MTATSSGASAGNDLMWGADKQIGPAYDFSVGKEPSSARITFKVDPSRLASAVGVKDASPYGLYIQVFEPALQSWVPLKSAYNVASHTVSAVAPHLSMVGLNWTEVQCILDATSCTALVYAKISKQFAKEVADDIKEAFPPTQPDECADKADTAWAVLSSVKKLSGCLISTGTPTSPEVQVQNPLLLPMSIKQPDGAPHATVGQPYLDNPKTELTTLITEVIEWVGNATVAAPRSYAVIPVQKDLSTTGQLHMTTTPDMEAVVMDMVMSLLFALPGAKGKEEAIDDAVKEVLPRFLEELRAGKSVALSDILDAVEEDVKHEKATAMTPVLTFAETLKGVDSCVTQFIGSDVSDLMHKDGVTDGVIDAAAKLAQKCVDSGYMVAGKELNESLKNILTLVDSLTDLGKTFREVVQWGKLGSAATFAVTIAERTAYDLTKSPFFQTPDHNITCGLPEFRWSPKLPSEPSNASQVVECRIKEHSVAPASCPDRFEDASAAASMAPDQAATFACRGDESDQPMYTVEQPDGSLTSRAPYQAQNGQNVNLGPVTCFVLTSSVNCGSNAGQYAFYLDRDHFTPSPAPEVLAAQNTALGYISVTTGVFKPVKYPVGPYDRLSDISWTEWDATQASGSGTYSFNTCQPQCLANNYRTDQDVKVTFTAPELACGQLFFTKLEIQDPADSDANVQEAIAPDTDAQGRQCAPPGGG